jgi:hypothetical protein
MLFLFQKYFLTYIFSITFCESSTSSEGIVIWLSSFCILSFFVSVVFPQIRKLYSDEIELNFLLDTSRKFETVI